MTATIESHSGLDELRKRLSGTVVGPPDPGWDSARQAWNLAVDQRPAAVVLAADTADVIATVEFAREHGLGIAPQGTGHGAATLGMLDDALLLKTMRMGGVEVDAGRRCARVEAGALWGDVALAAASHGLAPLAGSSADVGVVGYTLGGGIGWLARRHGLACNSVRAIEIVTADAEHARVDGEHEPELFWALRGGGGSFGVVTAIEFALYPLAEVYAGMVAWPVELASDALIRYLEITREAPEELSACLRFLNLPPVPAVPEPFRGRPVVVIDAVYAGGRDGGGAELLRPLRSLPRAVVDTFGVVSPRHVLGLHGDPEQPHPGVGDGLMLDAMPDQAAARFLELGTRRNSALVSLELRHLGGALRRADRSHGALDALEGEYVVYGVGSPMDETSRSAIEHDLDLVAARMKPWTGERSYLNFADRDGAAARAFPADTYRRLQEIKTKSDPDDVFRSNHRIVASGRGERT